MPSKQLLHHERGGRHLLPHVFVTYPMGRVLWQLYLFFSIDFSIIGTTIYNMSIIIFKSFEDNKYYKLGNDTPIEFHLMQKIVQCG